MGSEYNSSRNSPTSHELKIVLHSRDIRISYNMHWKLVFGYSFSLNVGWNGSLLSKYRLPEIYPSDEDLDTSLAIQKLVVKGKITVSKRKSPAGYSSRREEAVSFSVSSSTGTGKDGYWLSSEATLERVKRVIDNNEYLRASESLSDESSTLYHFRGVYLIPA